MLTKCKSCGTEMLDRLKKCPNCQFSMVEEPKKNSCSKCAKEVPDFAAFCPFCGNALEKIARGSVTAPMLPSVKEEKQSVGQIPKQGSFLPICGACGKEQFDDVKICAFCGGNVLPPGSVVAVQKENAKLVGSDLPTCRACGKELFDNVLTCPFCGAGVSVSIPGAENLPRGIVFVKCKICGKEVPSYMDNCPKCKEPLVIDDVQLRARRDLARQIFQNLTAREPDKPKRDLTDAILIALSCPVAIPALILIASSGGFARWGKMPTWLAVASGFIVIGGAYYIDATWQEKEKPFWVPGLFFFLLFCGVTGVVWLVRRAMKE